MVKYLPAVWETRIQSLGWEDSLEKSMATHSSILAWRIPWTEEPGKLQSMGFQIVKHDWMTNTFTKTFWYRIHGIMGNLDLCLTLLYVLVLSPEWLSSSCSNGYRSSRPHSLPPHPPAKGKLSFLMASMEEGNSSFFQYLELMHFVYMSIPKSLWSEERNTFVWRWGEPIPRRIKSILPKPYGYK